MGKLFFALFQRGTEQVLASGSINQCKLVFAAMLGQLRMIDPQLKNYRVLISGNRLAAEHKPTGTAVRAVGSNAKTSLGLGASNRLVVFDEPAALHENLGTDLWDSLEGAIGKPDSKMTILACGTRAPALPTGWWPQLLDEGTSISDGIYVEDFTARRDKWRHIREVRRVNPIKCAYPDAEAKLLRKWEAAKRGRKEGFFRRYLMNIGDPEDRQPLIKPDDWEQVMRREPAKAEGEPIIGFDLGGTRAWSAIVALWPTGLVDAVAVVGGLPGIEEREKMDKVPSGTYSRLVANGSLIVDHGYEYARPAFTAHQAMARWPDCEQAVCDRFKVSRLREHWPGFLDERVSQWAQSTEDIDALRVMANDEGMSLKPACVELLTYSMSQALVVCDTSGNERIEKHGIRQMISRDDCASALALACGAEMRRRDTSFSFASVANWSVG